MLLQRGEKILVLKKKFRPDHTSADLSKQDPNVSASPEASLGVSQVQDDSSAKCESETTSSQQSEGPSEGNSNHLSNTSSVASVSSTVRKHVKVFEYSTHISVFGIGLNQRKDGHLYA